jgi:predicted nucleotide-binding protein
MLVTRSIKLPDLGEGSTEVTIVRWLATAGTSVAHGDPIVELNRAGALVRIGAPYSGRLTSLGPELGARVKAGHQLALIETTHHGASTEAIVLEVAEGAASTSDRPAGPRAATTAKTTIFVVHGRDGELKEAVARLLERCVANADVIVLHEQANRGRTIIEKFEQQAAGSAYAVVLMTADDHGALAAEAELRPRARQNVILELGYFLGSLGRDRVTVLNQEGIEAPSDILGIAYIAIDPAGRWRFDLAHELAAAGLAVNLANVR